MTLSETAQQNLASWISRDTWHTKHNSDMNRWYEFVDQYQKDHGFTIDEHDLRNHIADVAGCADNEVLLEIISQKISLAYSILDFLKCTGR